MSNGQNIPHWSLLDIFQAMSSDAIAGLDQVMAEQAFAPGEVIIQQGDPGDEMFILDEGAIRIEITDDGEVQFETHLEAPAVFGEMALVTKDVRSASVVASTRARCKRLDRAGFNQLVADQPAVASFLTEAVGRRLLETDGITSVGKYRITGRLGSGGAATVFEGVQPELGQKVALKMLSHSLVSHPSMADKFKREAQLIAGLKHDHVVRVIDTEAAYGTHFIIMERLRGTLLEEMIDPEVPMAFDTIRKILIEVCSALEFAHDHGLLHRDIKPSNVFFTSSRRAKILDFGIAVETNDPDSRPTERLGTPYYMAPEHILGRTLDRRSDLYSVGIMAYELVTAEVPFDGATLPELLRKHLTTPMPDPRLRRPDLADDLWEFILRATAKHPDDRFVTCGEAVDFLSEAAELPVVQRLDLVTIAISHHPRHRERVAHAIEQLRAQLSHIVGVSMVATSQLGAEGP